jgi:hypothetical protein
MYTYCKTLDIIPALISAAETDTETTMRDGEKRNKTPILSHPMMWVEF